MVSIVEKIELGGRERRNEAHVVEAVKKRERESSSVRRRVESEKGEKDHSLD